MNSSPEDDRLSRALRTWRISPKPDPDFRPAVWQRIHQRARESWATYVRGHLVGWGVTAAFAVTAAGWTGHRVAEARIDAQRDQMATSYLVELDPRVLAKLRPE